MLALYTEQMTMMLFISCSIIILSLIRITLSSLCMLKFSFILKMNKMQLQYTSKVSDFVSHRYNSRCIFKWCCKDIGLQRY